MTVLPDGWRWQSLNELAADGVFVDGDWVESKDQDPDGSVRLTQLADVGVAHFRDRSDRWLREDQAERLSCTRLVPGDILIARMPDPIGRACMVPEGIGAAVSVVDVAILRLRRTDVDARYVMWAINAPEFHQSVVAKESGTTRKRISRRNLGLLQVPLPSIEEQRRIVDLLEDHLSRLDVASSQVRSSADRLLQLRLGQLRRWRTESLEASPDGPRALGEVAETSLGKMLDAKRSSGESTAYLRNINVRWGRIDMSDVFTVPLSDQERAKFSLRQGDLLVCEGGEPGRAAIWESDQPMTFQKALHRVRVRPGADVLVPFLQLMLEEFVRTGRAADMFTGTTIKHLPQEKLRQIRIPLPPAHLQARVLAEAEAADSASARLDDELRQVEVRSQALRRSLLAVAFTGQLTRTAPISEGLYV